MVIPPVINHSQKKKRYPYMYMYIYFICIVQGAFHVQDVRSTPALSTTSAITWAASLGPCCPILRRR